MRNLLSSNARTRRKKKKKKKIKPTKENPVPQVTQEQKRMMRISTPNKIGVEQFSLGLKLTI